MPVVRCTVIEKQTIADSAYEQIKHDIIQLRLAPGKKLSEATLSQKYNVSRAPIRVALRRLQEDGLIEIRPQSGSIVCPISIDRALNIIDVRLLLEPYAVKRAISHITDADINYLNDMFLHLDQMELGSDERSRYVSSVDIELHSLLQTRCGNRVIPEIINRYASEIQRIRRANIQWSNRMGPSEQEMRHIFAAIKLRDVKRTERAMVIHLQNIRTALSTLIDQNDAHQ